MRFLIILFVAAGIFWALDKAAYDGHYGQVAEREVQYLAKTIGEDLRSFVDRLVGKG
jgi:hypothetical protein